MTENVVVIKFNRDSRRVESVTTTPAKKVVESEFLWVRPIEEYDYWLRRFTQENQDFF